MSSGTLMPAPCLRATDADGAPISGAQLAFFLSGTTTPTPVYADAGLASPLSNPVAADSGGLFAPIFLDGAVTYRARLLDAAGALIADMDPVSFVTPAASQVEVNAGAAAAKYVSPATLAGWTGVAAALGYAPLDRAGDTWTNGLIDPASTPMATSAGYLGSPVNEQDGNYAVALGDDGRTIRHASASPHAWTIEPIATTALPTGAVIVFRNAGAGTVTITRGAGVTLRLAGSATSQDVALAPWGWATAQMESADAWVISGTGLS